MRETTHEGNAVPEQTRDKDNSFSVITPARNSAHRFTLEALYIRSLRPELCRQKKHIKVLRLFKLQPD